MMKKIIVVLVLAASLFSCTDKFDTGFISSLKSTGTIGDTLYIQQFPQWKGFSNPKDMLVGKDNFIYVADTDNNRIVMLDVAGNILGTLIVKHPTVIDQDFRLNLIICAEFDTLISGSTVTFDAVYKVDLVAVSHDINAASLTKVLPATSFDLLRPDRQYKGISVFYDNSYFIARTGPSNSNNIDPDNSILEFINKKRADGTRYDSLSRRLPLFEPLGTGLLSANGINALVALKSSTKDFIMGLTGNNSFKVQWMQFISTSEFSGYVSKLDAFDSELMKINKFKEPSDLTFDNNGNLFVTDTEKDSVYKFNQFGDELESFGGIELFENPEGVAFFDKTLYVLDSKNGKILRFILSTELE
ncbi:MAG: hypothetical protein K9I69_04775 [Ignavibacteriales bacterium]|nr:hypothetical protein [Ignavibacteriales bacterium]MCF8306438.1 hypothetical protein [Ignavibacteriales bacterium]MCF8435707.1 hypothetical protein [Ignavibacteriales bacterium]